MLKRLIPVGIAAVVLCVSSCKGRETENTRTTFIIKGDTVHITDSNILSTRIKTGQVKQEAYSKEVITAGTVQAIPTRFAYIAPPFPGRVVKSHITLGQKVHPHTPLFDINAPEFMTVQKEFFQAQSERELAVKDLKRKEDLIKYGVGSQKELEEAQNALMIAEKEYENARAAIRVFQTDPENMVFGEPMVVRSPIAGEIIENNIITGQYLNDDAEYVAIVADLSEVWVTAQVKERDIRFIHVADDMDIHISALPGEPIRGKVFHIDESIDEETRSIKVLSVCNNKEGLLKLGMFATVHFLDEPQQAIVIPDKALLQDENHAYVFVQYTENCFVKRPVEVEVTKDGKAIIAAGLNPGDVIISEGGYYLK